MDPTKPNQAMISSPGVLSALTAEVFGYFTSKYVQTQRKPAVTIVFGRGDLALAREVADQYQLGYVSRVLVTGGVGKDTGDIRPFTSEAGYLATEMVRLGVPESLILIEPKARNGGENCRLALDMLELEGALPTEMILVGHPETLWRLTATMQYALFRRGCTAELHLSATAWTGPYLYDPTDLVCQDRVLGEFLKLMEGPGMKPEPYTVPVDLPAHLVNEVWTWATRKRLADLAKSA